MSSEVCGYVYLQVLIVVRLLVVRARVEHNVLSEFDSWQYERVRWYSVSSEVFGFVSLQVLMASVGAQW